MDTAEHPLCRSGRAHLASSLVAGVTAVLLAGALPAVASATDYCVAPNTSCGGTNVPSFENALDLADNAADADRIVLGAATYTAPVGTGYNYAQSYPVEIVGQGIGQTVLTGPIGASAVLTFYGTVNSEVHDLTIRLPQNVVNGASGLESGSAARRIEVVEDPTQNNQRYGVNLAEYGATLENSRVALGEPHLSNAVRFGQPGVSVRGSTLSAWTAVRSNGGAIERSRLTATNAGVAAERGVTTLDRSVVRITEGSSVGIYASAASGSHTTLNADGVTLIGPGLPNTDGAEVFNNFAPGEAVDLTITNSILRGFEHPLWADSAGPGQATISASYSDYEPSGNVLLLPNASITPSNVSNVGDARFVDPAGRDYHLLAASPLIDAGDPASAPGLDLDGNPLVADGNGDSTARRDLGAFELQATPPSGPPPAPASPAAPAADNQAPLVSGFKATPKLFAVARGNTPLAARLARGTRLRYTLTENARATITIRRLLPRRRTVAALRRTARSGANTTRFTGRIRTRALRPGPYKAVIRATDAAGNRSAPRATRFRIAPR